MSAHERIKRRIRALGPIGVAEYMAVALTDPEDGYYTKRDPFGVAGDFVTAPEVTQMFGELIGLWAVAVWHNVGRPDPVALVELGPGRGTLMADTLRAARYMPEFLAAIDLHLVEVSPVLRGLQRAALPGFNIDWHDHVGSLPDGPSIVVANEFFDALPIRQFQRRDDAWHERLIGLDSEDRLQFVLGPMIPAALLTESNRAEDGAVAELSPMSIGTVDALARQVSRFGGAVLIVDYGDGGGSSGPTLQALRRHARHDVLIEPGTADMTAHVDFRALARAATEAGAAVFGPIEQGVWLRRLGIEERARRLRRDADRRQAQDIDRALDRLLAPEAMGSLFKAMAVARRSDPTPPGFEGDP